MNENKTKGIKEKIINDKEKARKRIVEKWEKLLVEDPELAELVKIEVDGDNGSHQRCYYEGFIRASGVLLPQVLFAPMIGQKVASYMRAYAEWQLDRI